MNFSEIAHKKVLGVPLLYVGLIVVGILAVVAYKLKAVPATSTDASGDAGSDGAAGAGDGGSVTSDDLAGSVYDGLKTTGTVVVAPTPTADDTTATTETNATWVTKGITWLVSNDKASGTDASAALSAYVQGQDLTYDQGLLVNAWIKQEGPAPDGVDTPGKIATQPAQRQFPSPPGVHTVKGANDNTYGAMLTLYYGGRSGQQAYDFLQAANPNLGLSGPFPVGSKINIPVWHDPVYYTLPSNMTVAQICAKNGITSWQFLALNNDSKQNWNKGTKVRVK